jgi:hypothetical protein
LLVLAMCCRAARIALRLLDIRVAQDLRQPVKIGVVNHVPDAK